MKRKRTLTGSRQRGGRAMTRKPASSGKVAFVFVFCLCIMGCLWVGKENWHNRLSNQALSLEHEFTELRAQADQLRTELLDLSEFTKIEQFAHQQLGMVAPQMPPDTIWCEEDQPQQLLGAMVFFNY